ncbi:MAG: PDZ domain-containing protein, partial [Firmicutes bacterium]|nr:PDZ domain-containing protein [Bacillota bacterium]
MFFKKFKKISVIFLLSFIIMPASSLAYSDYIYAGGENIGIELHSKGIMVVGMYKVGEHYPAKDAGLKNGDIIKAVEDKQVSNIGEMVDVIHSVESKENIKITYMRGLDNFQTHLKVTKEDTVYKTGLYVKDSITGIGTLSFIDPNTKLFGSLGHEILEKTTGKILDIKDGKIFDSTVTDIVRSEDGAPGEKNARFYTDKINGTIFSNTEEGIFGNYTNTLPNKKLYKVAKPNEIKTGKAQLLTVTKGNEVKEYNIEILKISNDDKKNKNILFEVTDEELLSISGGVVAGMSGSPII